MAIHFPAINFHPLDRAVTRSPAPRQPSNSVASSPALGASSAIAGGPSGLSTSSASSSPSSAGGSGNSIVAAANSLFPINPPLSAPVTAAPVPPPTAQSVFGATPWITNPTGTGPTGTYTYNPYYFATPQTAAAVAQMVGGQVVSMNSMSAGSQFVQNQPNLMVQLPNGALINPGLVASFYTHGYAQPMVNQMITNEVSNVSKGT